MTTRTCLLFGLLAAASGLSVPAQQPPKTEAPEAPVKGAPEKFVPGTPMPGTTGLQPGPGAKAVRPGNAWFPVVERDLGTVVGEDHVTTKFTFKNPHNEPFEWTSLFGSCQCTKSVIRVGDRVYEHATKANPPLVRISKGATGVEQREAVTRISIGAGEEGEIEVHMEMQGVTGPRMASLDLHSTDATTPHTKLQWTATGAKLLVVSPEEVNLNKMTWSESREFQVTVTSPIHKDFNILRMDEAKGFDVKWTKEQHGGQSVWTIRGTYGPLGEEAAGGGALKFYTDLRGESHFLVRVLAIVQGPLEVRPGGFLPLGRIVKGNAVTKDIVFQPNDGQKLEATSLRIEKATVGTEFLEVSQTMDGNNLIVHLEIKKDAPTGLLKGEVVVELNHPAVKERRIMFNGFVR